MISNLPGYFPLNVLEFDLQKLFIDKFACYNQCMSLYILEKTVRCFYSCKYILRGCKEMLPEISQLVVNLVFYKMDFR